MLHMAAARYMLLLIYLVCQQTFPHTQFHCLRQIAV
eukprot:Gb_26652 [translate_table: standard]